MSRQPRHTLPPTPVTDGIGSKAIAKEDFGRRLSAAMLDMGWNQSELARRAGLGRDSISTYVRGQVIPEPKSLKALADALGLAAHDLLPDSTFSAMEAETPALEIRQAHGHADRVFLRINQLVTLDQAARIFAILRENHNHA